MTDTSRPTLGVLITYYNERELLTECLESLFAGEELPDEVWVYDDASPHPAADYIPIVLKDRVQLVRGDENRGPSYGRNYLIHQCQCEYVQLFDADDLFCPNWARAVRRALATRPDIVVSRGLWRAADGQDKRILATDVFASELLEDHRRFGILRGYNTPCLTFRRALCLEIGGYQTHDLVESLDFFMGAKLALHAESLQFVNEHVFIVRERASSLSRNQENRPHRRSYVHNIRALEYLSQLTSAYRLEMAKRISVHAYRLYLSGEAETARWADQVARQLGHSVFEFFGPWRTIARMIGPPLTHHLYVLYAHPTFVQARRRVKDQLQRYKGTRSNSRKSLRT